MTMIPMGYMLKKVGAPPKGWFDVPSVESVLSVSSHVHDDFADYIDFWRHNGWWLFDRPEIMLEIARGAEDRDDRSHPVLL